VYSLLTNLSLFELFDMGSRDYLDDDHILQMIELLGPLPADLKSAWLRYRNYFDENDIQTVFVVDWAPSLGNLDESLIEEEEEGQYGAESDMDLSDSNADEDDEEEACKARRRAPEPANAAPTQQLYPSLVEVVYDGRTSHALDSDLGEGSDAHTRPAEPPLRDRWLRDKHPAMAPEEAEAVASLLQQILQYDPAERPTTTDLLRHPWIEKFCAGKGADAVP
jgi:serine/threonine protein kinase